MGTFPGVASASLAASPAGDFSSHCERLRRRAQSSCYRVELGDAGFAVVAATSVPCSCS